MPKKHKYICSRSEASVPDATSQIEGLTPIVSKEWNEEVQNPMVVSYRSTRALLCTIGDAAPQEILEESKEDRWPDDGE